MKDKLRLLITLLILGCLTGCGGQKAAENDWEAITQSEEMEADEETEMTKEPEAPKKPPVSAEALEIKYRGPAPFDYVTASYDTVYLLSRDNGDGSFLMKMKTGADTAEKMPVTLPDGMEFLHFATDKEGKLYCMVADKDSAARCQIWKIDKDGTVEEKIDISEHMGKDSWKPWAMAVSGNHDIYLRVGGLNGILAMVFDQEGNLLSQISDEGKYQLIDAMGRGKDGKIYAMLMTPGDKQLIAELDGGKGTIGKVYENVLQEGAGMYACIGEGTDTDLLIYGLGTGIFAYNIGEEAASLRVPASKFSFDDSGKSLVLADGRLLIIQRGIAMKEDRPVSTVEGTIFHYIPAGNEELVP